MPAIVAKLDEVLFGRNIEIEGAECPKVRTVIGDASNWPLSAITLILSSISVIDNGDPVSRAVLDKQPDAQVVIPPHKTAVCSDAGDSQRDRHIQTIAQEGRIAWQRKTSYNLRSHVELAMQRYKRIFGNLMKARALPQQKTEAGISASALNRMTNLGMPVSVKI